MKSVKNLESGGFYLLKGISAANTLFFEDFEEKIKFQKMIEKYLSNMIEIREYCLKPDGWTLLVKLKDERTIKKHFDLMKSGSASKGANFVKIWEKISEMVRIMLSQYSKWANRKRGRIGSLVGNSYQRFYFETGEEALEKLTEMREDKVNLKQPLKRFRPKMKHYDKDGKIASNTWIKTSRMVQEKLISLQEIGLNSLILWEASLVMVSKLVEFTLNLHITKKSTKFST